MNVAHTSASPNANQDYFAYTPFTFGPGDVKFVDRNGDGQLNNGIEGMYKLGGKFYIPRESLPANFPKHQTTLGNYINVIFFIRR